VVRFHVDAEGRKAAVVRYPKPFFGDVFCGSENRIAYLFRGFDSRVQRVDYTDKAHLRNAVGVGTRVLATKPVYLIFVLLGGGLNQEVSSVHLEQRRKKFSVVDVRRMDTITIP
jgi:hypothetical protein